MQEQEFGNRRAAGRRLGEALAEYTGRHDVVVLGLPRGGVEVAYEVARELGAPLDVLVVRKLGFPGQEELAMGAVAAGGVRVVNPGVMRRASGGEMSAAVAREAVEVERREAVYREGRPPLQIAGKTVIVVDDGLATGATMLAGIAALRTQGPASVVAAVPVGEASVVRKVGKAADRVVCLKTVTWLGAVGMWYGDFEQTDDTTVRELLASARLATED